MWCILLLLDGNRTIWLLIKFKVLLSYKELVPLSVSDVSLGIFVSDTVAEFFFSWTISTWFGLLNLTLWITPLLLKVSFNNQNHLSMLTWRYLKHSKLNRHHYPNNCNHLKLYSKLCYTSHNLYHRNRIKIAH